MNFNRSLYQYENQDTQHLNVNRGKGPRSEMGLSLADFLSLPHTHTPSHGDNPNVPNAITIRLNTFQLVAPSRSVLPFNSPTFRTFYSLLECSVLSRNVANLLHLQSKGAKCGRRTAASHLSPNSITLLQPSGFVSPSSDPKSRLANDHRSEHTDDALGACDI